ncbi:MAG: hypothetical protein WBG32_03150 [Nodosilinea sp.]
MALGPGFEIKNETIWPLQISLDQVGPLYFDLVQPGETFVRNTGAVWFTIRAAICLDEKDKITTWDAVWPIGAMTVGVLAAAVATAVTAGAAGPAIAGAAGAASAGASTTLTGAALVGVTALAPTMVGLGVPAGAALVVSGLTVGGTIAAGSAASTALLNVFKEENSVAKRPGSYAGPPWPFRENRYQYAVIGGPGMRKLSNGQEVELFGQKLEIVNR